MRSCRVSCGSGHSRPARRVAASRSPTACSRGSGCCAARRATRAWSSAHRTTARISSIGARRTGTASGASRSAPRSRRTPSSTRSGRRSRTSEGRASAEQGAREAEHALELAQAELDGAIRTLAGFEDETAARDRLAELRETRDGARARVDQLGRTRSTVTLNAAADWDRLSLDARRALIRATVERAQVAAGARRRPRHRRASRRVAAGPRRRGCVAPRRARAREAVRS